MTKDQIICGNIHILLFGMQICFYVCFRNKKSVYNEIGEVIYGKMAVCWNVFLDFYCSETID